MVTEDYLKIPEDTEFVDEDVFSNDCQFSGVNEFIIIFTRVSGADFQTKAKGEKGS